jgi:phosphate transport system substrate-binding protein
MKKLLVTGLMGLLVTVSASAQMLINGAGSTFDYPVLSKWFDVYSKIDTTVQFNYQSIGSGGGLRQVEAQTVDFGASDAPMTDKALADAPGKILHFPIVAGGLAIAYNLPGNPKLKLDSEAVAGIYLGTITKWNDPKIAGQNPGVTLPDTDIVVVHRSDGSGTTYIFVDYLSSVSKTWASQVGKSTSVKWPIGLGAKGNEGVAGQVKQLEGAVGYVELAYAVQNQMTYADLKNAAGNYVPLTLETVSAAMATAVIPDDFRFSIVNSPGEQAYPISGASWILIYQEQKDAARGKKLVEFLKWAVTDGQKLSTTLNYAPLPDNVVQRILARLGDVKF